MDKLRDKFLNVALDAVLHPASLTARHAATEQKGAAAQAPTVAEEELTAQQWFERGVNATDPLREFASIPRPSVSSPTSLTPFTTGA